MITAVDAERDVLAEQCARRLGALRPATVGPYRVLIGAGLTLLSGGVGPAAAAAATATALQVARLAATGTRGYDLVVSAGIGGGFADRANVGDLVVATELRAADLGADSDDGFLSVDQLGFGVSVVPATDVPVNGEDVRRGPVLTVSTVTGTEQRARQLEDRFAATAEAMEGFGVAEAARIAGVGVAEVRGISNRVGRRDRSAWDVPAGLAALRRAADALVDLVEHSST